MGAEVEAKFWIDIPDHTIVGPLGLESILSEVERVDVKAMKEAAATLSGAQPERHDYHDTYFISKKKKRHKRITNVQ